MFHIDEMVHPAVPPLKAVLTRNRNKVTLVKYDYRINISKTLQVFFLYHDFVMNTALKGGTVQQDALFHHYKLEPIPTEEE